MYSQLGRKTPAIERMSVWEYIFVVGVAVMFVWSLL